MRKVLIVDDDPGILEILKEEITKAIVGVECHTESNIDTGIESVGSLRPDAVVLDLRQGSATTNLPGERTWRAIWNGRFCPVIVYTAGDGDMTPPIPENHPFAKLVVKGKGSVEKVVELLKGFVPHVSAIKKLHEELDVVVHRVLRDTAGAAIISGTEAGHLVHAARRRVAALMDEATTTENRTLFSWEQYLIPALGQSPLTGDVLRKHGASWTDASAHRLILSPSCDMQVGRNEPCVLVARCKKTSELTKLMSLPKKADDAVKRIKTQVLTQGFLNGFLPLPQFEGIVPLAVACLKDLEAMEFGKIGPATILGTEYERVASIDSPFREQVAWAFVNTVARPGMPDRDLEPWAQAIVAEQATVKKPA